MMINLSQLDNGLRVASRTMPHVSTLSIGVWIGVGARDELENEQGIAHMLEHMAFKGTHNRDAKMIASEVENVGGHMNAHTSREETAYYLRLLPEHIDLGVEILADILTQSTLPELEIERERGVIIQEIGQSLDSPDDLVFDLFAKACFEGHTLARSILGTVDSVSSFSKNDLKTFMSRHYGSGQMLVCAAGKVEHEDLLRRVEERFGCISDANDANRKAASWSGGRQLLRKDLEQAHVIFGLPAPAKTIEDRFTLMALSTLYGGGMSSRLFQQVREKRGLCYSIFSFSMLNSDGGSFGVYAGTAANSVNEMLSVSAQELKDIAETVNDEEIVRTKAQLRANLLMGRESVSACGDALARQIMLFGKPKSDEALLAAIDQVDGQSVSEMAGKLIDTGSPSLAYVGPLSDLMENDDLEARLKC